MGDHRASIKIEMSFHGIEDKCDMWINYSPGEYDGVDDTVIKFFQSVYDRGMAKYDKEQIDYWHDQNKEKKEKQDREEYERLKKKYEKQTPSGEGPCKE